MIPTREEAERILKWGQEIYSGPWVEHCKVVSRVAETVANTCGMDADKAYVMGLMHDIGYYEYKNGIGRSCHIYIGYELMLERGYNEIAKICLTHSFPVKNIKAYGNPKDIAYCSSDEISVIENFLLETVYDDYDKLIQLSDTIGATQGTCLMEKRMLDVIMRHGFNELSIEKCKSYLDLKKYFDSLCNGNIYNLFREELINDMFM